MHYRWVPAVIAMLALLPGTVLAAGDGGGYGHVFPAPDPSDPVDVPAPFPAPPAAPLHPRQFPAGAEPQPTFVPANASAHVYVAARDSTIVPPNTTTPNGTPLNATVFLCDGAGDEREINDAIAAAQGGIVELLDGNFRCADRITLRDNTTLRGQGSMSTTIETRARPGASGYLPIAIDAPYVNVGGFTMRGNAFIMVTRSHVRVRDVRATSVDLDGVWRRAYGNGMFFVWVTSAVDPAPGVGGAIDDVEFYQCHVTNAHTHGFNLNQDYTDRVVRATTNIRFLDCSATRCGYGVYGDPGVGAPVTATNQSKSEWITGFDLHEWQDLINCEVVNCVASDNWESGFHLEPGARYTDPPGPRTVSRNIVFRNCVSSNNGQRNTYASHFFMSGYYLSRDTHLEDCQSFNNRNCGYYVHSGANSSFVGCTDDGSTYGWKVCKASEEIAITDCTSANNSRWAFWLAFSRRIHVANFRHTGVASDRGYQSILGWYKDEPQYQLPVTDSSFEITAVGNGMPIINQAGTGNAYMLRHEGSGSADPVTAAFTATPVSGDAPLTVRFADTSTGSTLRWWSFGDMGDGNTSVEQRPVHVYATPGNYTVTLMAANDFLYDTATRVDCINVIGPVTASFAAAPTVVPAGESVRFTGSATGNPSTFAWDFGDGSGSTLQSPVHIYTRTGTYDVSLTAANALYSNTTTVPALVTVLDRVNASFTANRTSGSAPLVVGFTDTSTGGPASWTWDFGDGATSTERDPVHTYAASGTYTVRLTVANAASSDTETVTGCIDVALALPAIRALPGCSDPPTDTDGDTRYEDVNGNGRPDFADVTLFFAQMSWILDQQPRAAFDYNGNDRIDFADVVWLFNRL